jgi:hypothetical protein
VAAAAGASAVGTPLEAPSEKAALLTDTLVLVLVVNEVSVTQPTERWWQHQRDFSRGQAVCR